VVINAPHLAHFEPTMTAELLDGFLGHEHATDNWCPGCETEGGVYALPASDQRKERDKRNEAIERARAKDREVLRR
jgi:hypothetical protein